MQKIQVKGMSCQHCVAAVKEALEKISGISQVTVSLEENQASYEGEISKEQAKEAIEAIGFEVE